MTRTVTAPVAALTFVAAVALAAAFGAYQGGYRDGRLAAYRETDRVLRDLERALAPIARHAQTEEATP